MLSASIRANSAAFIDVSLSCRASTPEISRSISSSSGVEIGPAKIPEHRADLSRQGAEFLESDDRIIEIRRRRVLRDAVDLGAMFRQRLFERGAVIERRTTAARRAAAVGAEPAGRDSGF